MIRKMVPQLKKDRPMYKDIEAVKNLIRNGELLTAVNACSSQEVKASYPNELKL